ncbi:MAG: ROK family protein [Gemmatimonadaceae bacterium]|nr:ROK family protein [Gemmatimonadaceae bacterium]
MPGSHFPPDAWIVGVDLGGTNIAIGALQADGSREVAFHSEPTLAVEGPEAVTERIVKAVERTITRVQQETGATRAQFVGVGIGAPGPLDRARGVVITAPNLGWTDWPLREKVHAATGLHATLDNDANCATLGEWWLGAARGTRNAIGITIGTGIGGGIVIDGQLYHGASDVAGEIGHVTIDSTGRRCKCGNYGCLEAYASGPAIAERAREAMWGEEPGVLWRLVEGDVSRITAQMVYAASKQGDPIAIDVVRETARYLGAGIGALLNVLNPEVVVLAGGVVNAGESLFQPLRAEVKRRAFRPAVEACRIMPGALGGSAGVVGAVAAFLQQTRGLDPA